MDRRQTATIGGLVLLACLVQVWMLWRAVVPAQDAVRYLIVSQGIERDGLVSTLRSQPEQPLFPTLACVIHQAFGVFFAGNDNWAICLQAAAAIGLVLSVVPVHALFCRFHGERAGLLGALLYVLLGGIARLGADGLSDSTHLALFFTAIWAAARYFAFENHPGAIGWLFLTGSSAGFALVARSEAIVVPLAVLGALVGLQLFRPHRSSWRSATAAASVLLVGMAVVLVPYLVLSDAYMPTDAFARLTGRRGAAEAAPLNAVASDIAPTAIEPRWEVPGQGRLIFGKKDTSKTTRFRGYPAAASKLFEELAQTLHYWLGGAALIGLWTARRRMSSPLDRFMQCLCATLVAVAVFVAARAGYLSTRHVLLLVVLGLGWAGVGILAVNEWLARFVAGQSGLKGKIAWSFAKGWPVAFAAVLACGTDLLRPLHTTRTAHREAAQWLARCAGRSEAVLDSRGFTALYTGLKTYRYEAAQAAFSDPALTYVVVEQQELSAESRRSETMRWLLTHAGEPVARFVAAGAEKHGVAVYRWRPERFAQLGVQSYAR